jgi:hypothetical protein
MKTMKAISQNRLFLGQDLNADLSDYKSEYSSVESDSSVPSNLGIFVLKVYFTNF